MSHPPGTVHPMSRTRVRHRCSACGATSPKWLGRCPECDEWGSLVEEAAAPDNRRSDTGALGRVPVAITDVSVGGAPRASSGVGELDRVLGGGFVAGSVTLLGGEPGMGKSTLLLHTLAALAAAGKRCLLVAGEESPEQIRLRAERIGALHPDLMVVAETSVPYVLAHADTLRPDVLAVDSIQTVSDPDAPGVPGSVSQVRDCANALVRFAKEERVATVLVGHVTKEGNLAGPRVLEHVVDTVLAFEGDRHHALRLLRAVKHRFGSTDELGVFEMTSDGLRGVPDASALLLADRRPGAIGSMVVPVLDGARPLLVEAQTLVSPTNAPMPRRSAHGLESGRLALIVAVLKERLGVDFGQCDVFASIAGGVRVAEPGADLAVALALVGSNAELAIDSNVVAIGEIGLGGEIRQVPHAARRLGEAARMGFTSAVVPESTPDVSGIALQRVGRLDQAVECAGIGLAPGRTRARRNDTSGGARSE
jgi:DNA repair protein RadA/Sms